MVRFQETDHGFHILDCFSDNYLKRFLQYYRMTPELEFSVLIIPICITSRITYDSCIVTEAYRLSHPTGI